MFSAVLCIVVFCHDIGPTSNYGYENITVKLKQEIKLVTGNIRNSILQTITKEVRILISMTWAKTGNSNAFKQWV